MALVAQAIAHAYGYGTAFAVPALHDVDLRLEPGRMMVIVGASGSGKSTLLGVLAGMLAPVSGRVLVDDRDLSADPSLARGVIGLVFQNPESQLFAETVAADIAFGPRNLGMGAEETDALVRVSLAAVGLDEAAFAERSPFTLSGGEARRVAIAGVLAMRPRYLLLDEPTAGLDAEGRARVCAALARAREAAGIAVVTHDAEDFLPIADDVLVIAEGRVAFCGSVSALLEDPEPLLRAGVYLPPLLHAQWLAARRADRTGPLALDVMGAADLIASFRGDAA